MRCSADMHRSSAKILETLKQRIGDHDGLIERSIVRHRQLADSLERILLKHKTPYTPAYKIWHGRNSPHDPGVSKPIKAGNPA